MKNLFYITLLAVLLSNCSTERIEPKNELRSFDNTNTYLELNKEAEQVFEITEEGEGPIVGKKGSKVFISKEILMYPTGDSVHFPYTINLVELYSAKDMIYYQMPSLSNGTLLTTHGEIRLRAFKDDVELVLRPEKFWILEVPNSEPLEDMLCYYGNNAESNVNWTDLHNTLFTIKADGYTANVKEMGWVSCAKNAIEEQSTINYNFFSDTLDLNTLSTFIYLPEKEGLMQVQGSSSQALPLEEKMKIVSIGKQGETIYSFYKQDTVSADNSIEIILAPTNDSELNSLLNSL